MFRHRQRLFILLVLLLFALASTASELFASGRGIQLLMKDSSSVGGEILFVRDSELLLSKQLGASKKELERDSSLIAVIRFRDIRGGVLAGNRHILDGAGIGAAAGAVVGGFIGSASVHEDPSGSSEQAWEKWGTTIAGGFLGLISGLAIGFIVGANIVTGEQAIDIADPVQVELLRAEARYTDEEPEFLRKFQ